MSTSPRSPRPHLGEPLALDLIDTQWQTRTGPQDALLSPADTLTWLREHRLWHSGLKLTQVHDDLHGARQILRGVLEQPGDEQARAAFNALLSRGAIIPVLGPGGPEQHFRVTDHDRPVWLAAHNLLELLRNGPDRIKRCADPACVLYFYDTSPKNARRWHDMKVCGNRVKAARHYQRRHDVA